MYKIIFFDLDGTLLNDKKEILEESKQIIKKAQENGIQIVLCSGRQKKSVEPYRDIAETGDYIICSNGAEIYDCKNHQELFSCGVEKDFCLALYQFAIEKDFFVRADTKYGRYINNMDFKWSHEIELTEDLEDFFDKNEVLQITLGTRKEEDINNIVEQFKKIPYVKIENKYCIKHKEKDLWIINIINHSVSKGNAISGLCKYLKIDVEDAIAFGDDLNDVSMMKTVGLGIAMGNAIQIMKDSAKKTIGNNNEPSIAKCIEEIIEKNKM